MVPPLEPGLARPPGRLCLGTGSSPRSGRPAVVFGAALGALSVPVHPRVGEAAAVVTVERYAAGKRNRCRPRIRRTSLARCWEKVRLEDCKV